MLIAIELVQIYEFLAHIVQILEIRSSVKVILKNLAL